MRLNLKAFARLTNIFKKQPEQVYHLVIRVHNDTQQVVNVNEDRACSRTRSWLGG